MYSHVLPCTPIQVKLFFSRPFHLGTAFTSMEYTIYNFSTEDGAGADACKVREKESFAVYNSM